MQGLIILKLNIRHFLTFLDNVTVLLTEILQGARNLTQAELYVYE